VPYVKRDVAIALSNGRKAPTTAGELTYLLTMQLQKYLDYHAERAGGYRYENLAVCLGALEGAKMDLERRVLTPYEELAQATNGDVWPRHLLMGQGDEREDSDKPQDSLQGRGEHACHHNDPDCDCRRR
jgi:hypothetical protein